MESHPDFTGAAAAAAAEDSSSEDEHDEMPAAVAPVPAVLRVTEQQPAAVAAAAAVWVVTTAAAAAAKAATSDGLVSCRFSKPGSLGLKLNEHERGGVVVCINPGSQAEDHPQLCSGLLVRSVGGKDLGGMNYKEVLGVLKAAGRPLELRFEQLMPSPRARHGEEKEKEGGAAWVTRPPRAALVTTQAQPFRHNSISRGGSERLFVITGQ